MPKELDRGHVQTILNDIGNRMAGEADRGEVANYIPELARVSLNQFGIAVAPLEGPPITAGDAHVPFSIQSISKVFGLVVAIAFMAFFATMIMNVMSKYPWLSYVGLVFLIYLSAMMLYDGWRQVAEMLSMSSTAAT